MKKGIGLLLFAACFLTIGAAAQGMMIRNVDFGLKAGLSYATLRGGNGDEFNWKLGFAAGAFAEIPLTPAVSLQPEVLYVQKGATFQGPLSLMKRRSR